MKNKIRNWKTNSKFSVEERSVYVDSWNMEGNRPNILYWVKTEEMNDPKTQGYIGVGDRKRAEKSRKECIEQGFGTEENLMVIVLAEGTTGAMDYLESWYRSDFGIGWNYLRGGGRGFGGGSSAMPVRKRNFEELNGKNLFNTEYERIK